MSTLLCLVRKITVLPHPNADLLELGVIDGYRFVVAKGEWQTGELGVYIPEQSLLPPELISAMGLEGKLSGSEANRVKAIKLRGELSQGLFYKPKSGIPAHWFEGYDAREELGIEKYEPPIPTELRGQIEPAPEGWISFDVENIKAYPELFKEGMPVSITEKLHGSCLIVGLIEGKPYVSSKGFSARGVTLTQSATNSYWRVAQQEKLFEKLAMLETSVILLGELLGVQDLNYGLSKGNLAFRAFDLYYPETATFAAVPKFFTTVPQLGIPTVPELYRGAFSYETLNHYTNGTSSIANHIREGVVVKSVEGERILLKSISPAYLTRKGGTEFN